MKKLISWLVVKFYLWRMYGQLLSAPLIVLIAFMLGIGAMCLVNYFTGG